MANERRARKYLLPSKENKVSLLSHYREEIQQWVRWIFSLPSKIIHWNKGYRFKNKRINQVSVMFEDKQGEEMENNRVWVDAF